MEKGNDTGELEDIEIMFDSNLLKVDLPITAKSFLIKHQKLQVPNYFMKNTGILIQKRLLGVDEDGQVFYIGRGDNPFELVDAVKYTLREYLDANKNSETK